MNSAWHRLAEDRIKEAIDRCELDDVPTGVPLVLREYFALPPSERMGLTMLKNAGVVPPEVHILKEAEQLETELDAGTDPARRKLLSDKLQAKRVSFAMMQERRRRRGGD
jgi:hypothetical protein